MHHRLICVLLAALMPFLIAAPAFAQEGEPAFPVACGDLADDDCAILEEATLAAQELTSYAMDMSFDFSVGGIPDLPADPLAFGMQLGGRFAFNEVGQEVIARMTELGGDLGEEEMQALMEEMPDLVTDLYRGMSFDMTMSYSVPPELAALMSADSDVDFPEEMSFDMRMIDGMMYMNIGQLRDLIPESDDTFTSDWIGVDYVAMLEMQLENSSGMADDPMTTGAMSGLAMAQTMKQMQEFVAVERLEDVELDGQSGAVFAYTPDIVGFLASDAFMQMLDQMAPSLGEDAPSAAEMREAATMISFMAPMLFRDLEVSSQSTIGLDDFMTYSTSFNLVWDLASLMQFAAMSDPTLAESMGDAAPVVEMSFVVDMSDFNAEMEFETPEDVQIIPLDELMPADTSAVF